MTIVMMVMLMVIVTENSGDLASTPAYLVLLNNSSFCSKGV